VGRLHALVISHRDKDHEGGAASVLAAVAVDVLRSSLPAEHPLLELPVAHQPCRQGERWRWDGVDFEFLHPAADDQVRAGSSNAVSCVLRITGSQRTLLLTGDIGAAEEQVLLSRGAAVAADVVVPSHHGSGNASSAAFVAAAGARVALFSAGYRNRFGHPVPAVVERYRSNNAEIHRTDREGALQVIVGDGEPVVTAERLKRNRYWLRD
jgi:competence protein ComEC